MNGARRVALWLLPAEPVRTALAGLLNDLASRYDAPRFTPHITLFAGIDSRHSAPDQASLAQLTDGLAGCAVRVSGVGHSDQLFKTLYLQVAPNDALAALAQRARSVFVDAGDYRFEPHLSLIYKLLPASEREHLAGELKAPKSFECDTVSVVAPGEGGWNDVPAWRTLASTPLR